MTYKIGQKLKAIHGNLIVQIQNKFETNSKIKIIRLDNLYNDYGSVICDFSRYKIGYVLGISWSEGDLDSFFVPLEYKKLKLKDFMKVDN